MPDLTPDEIILENMQQPKIGQNNMGMFEQHSLKDQLEVAKRYDANVAGSNKFLGMIVQTFKMPGTQ